MERFAEREVDLSLPKLRLEWADSLTQALAALGMEVAVDPRRADFSAIAEVADLYVESGGPQGVSGGR